MKRLLMFIVMATMLAGCKDQGTYTITGTVNNLEGDMIYLCDATGNHIDSAKLKNGSFKLKGKAPASAQKCRLKSGEEESLFAMLFVEAGDIEVAGTAYDIEEIRCTGTPVNDSYNEFYDEYVALNQNMVTAEQLSALYKKVFDRNADNILGAMMFINLEYADSPDSLIVMYDRLAPEFQNNANIIRIKSEAENRKLLGIGQQFTDICLPDVNGKEVKLSDVVAANRYVLLNFWAGWSLPTVYEMKHLSDAYARYHKDGFEIYNLSLDYNREDWTKAIADNKMTWLNVGECNGWDSKARETYVIKGIPDNILIDSKGVIVARTLRGEKLSEKLAELMSE